MLLHCCRVIMRCLHFCCLHCLLGQLAWYGSVVVIRYRSILQIPACLFASIIWMGEGVDLFPIHPPCYKKEILFLHTYNGTMLYKSGYTLLNVSFCYIKNFIDFSLGNKQAVHTIKVDRIWYIVFKRKAYLQNNAETTNVSFLPVSFVACKFNFVFVRPKLSL